MLGSIGLKSKAARFTMQGITRLFRRDIHRACLPKFTLLVPNHPSLAARWWKGNTKTFFRICRPTKGTLGRLELSRQHCHDCSRKQTPAGDTHQWRTSSQGGVDERRAGEFKVTSLARPVWSNHTDAHLKVLSIQMVLFRPCELSVSYSGCFQQSLSSLTYNKLRALLMFPGDSWDRKSCPSWNLRRPDELDHWCHRAGGYWQLQNSPTEWGWWSHSQPQSQGCR